MPNRHIRNLARLQESASTARVLNLMAVWRAHRADADWAAAPLFQNPHLNRALIIKHRIRRNESDLFVRRRQVATKVVMPIDVDDLRLGGRYVFVDQANFTPLMAEVFGDSMPERDIETLRLLDRLPSLDPFLLREQLSRSGRSPARVYFELTEADRKRMFAFAQAEIAPLVAMSMGSDDRTADHAAVLVGKILSNADGEEMEPLRLTLRLAKEEYAEGVFCWKGFLYYKWSLAEITAAVGAVAAEIAAVKPVGPQDDEIRVYLGRSRQVLGAKITRALASVAATLKVYDDAYAHLTENGRPHAFREFLLDAPYLFTRLGDQVGALQHIVSFWRYRFSPGAGAVSVEELIDIFMDFEGSLSERDEEPTALKAA